MSNRRSIPILLVSFLTLVVILTITFSEWLNEEIIQPILRMFWFASLLVRSMDQSILWALLLLVVIIAATSALRQVKDSSQTYLEEWNTSPARGRVTNWAHVLNQTIRGGFTSELSIRELHRLAVKIMAYQRRTTPQEIERCLRTGEIEFQEDISGRLLADLGKSFPEERLYQRLLRRFFLRWFDRRATNQKRVDLETLKRWIDRLETESETRSGYGHKRSSS